MKTFLLLLFNAYVAFTLNYFAWHYLLLKWEGITVWPREIWLAYFITSVFLSLVMYYVDYLMEEYRNRHNKK